MEDGEQSPGRGPEPPAGRTGADGARPPLVAVVAYLLPAVTVVAAGCGGGPRPSTAPVGVGWSQEGTASWYGPGFHGRHTASGEVYDMDGMTAAHRTLPFGTWVRVVNRGNGRTARVRITDRGPFRKGRIIDLSRAAARELGMLAAGTARVRVEVVALPPEATCRLVQVGSFRDRENAEELAKRLRGGGVPVRLEPGPRSMTRVVVGPYPDARSARRAAAEHDGILRDCPRWGKGEAGRPGTGLSGLGQRAERWHSPGPEPRVGLRSPHHSTRPVRSGWRSPLERLGFEPAPRRRSP